MRVDLLLWIVGVAGGGWLVGYLVATQFFFPAPEPPQDLLPVPDLRAQGADQAQALSEQAGLALGRIEYLNHPQADSGSVLGQSPLPGQLALPGDSIRITVSLGPELRRGITDLDLRIIDLPAMPITLITMSASRELCKNRGIVHYATT